MSKIMIKNTGEWVEKPIIIAVDYDGTLDFAGFPNVGKLNQNAVDNLIKCQKEGKKVILWTCRAGQYLKAAVEECEKYGLVFDAVNENLPEIKAAGFDSPKILADIYIDDKAIGLGTDLDDVFNNLDLLGSN